MLARPHAQASTCLRCQYRSLRRQAQGEFKFPRPRLYTTSRRDDIESDDRSDRPSVVREVESTHRDLNIRTKHVRVGPRLRGRPGAAVREESARLSLDSLGKPTEVIVLRDVTIRAPPRLVDDPEETGLQEEDSVDGAAAKPGVSSNDILAGIKGENKRVSQDEINKRIEELRPTNAESTSGQAGLIPEKEYRKLFKTLSRGFTVNQLVNYLKTRDENEKSEALRPLPAVEGVQGSRTTDWRPTVAQDMNTRLSLHWKPWTEKTRQTPREKHARLIMGQGWGLLPLMPMSTPGQLEVQNLRAKSFEILTLGTPSPLQTIAATRNVKIETNQALASKHHVIRITGPQEDAALALEDMKGAIQGLKAEIFDMKPFLDAKVNDIRILRAPQQMSAEQTLGLRKLLRDSVRATCQQLTGSLVDQTEDDKISINVSSASQHEDAIRTVLASLDISAPMRKAPTTTDTPNRLAKGGLTGQIVPWNDSLPYILKNRVCSRLTSIASRVTSEKSSRDTRPKGRFNVEARDIQWDRLSQSLLHSSQSSDVLWAQPRLDLSVNIGRLLEARLPPVGIRRLSPIMPLHGLALQYFQTFAPSIGAMTRQISLDEAEGTDGVVIRLKPSSSNTSQFAEAHELRISFRLTQNGKGRPTAELQSIDLTMAESRAVQQLPELAADLQVTASLKSSLDSQHLRDEQFKGLNEFLQRVKVAISSSDPLRMPTTMRIGVPHQTVPSPPPSGEAIQETNSKVAKNKRKKSPRQAALPSRGDSSEDTSVAEGPSLTSGPDASTESNPTTTKHLDFRVIHIEHEQLRRGTFQDQPLALVSRESGRVGGKGLTLSMRRSYQLSSVEAAPEPQKASTAGGVVSERGLSAFKEGVLKGLEMMGGSMLDLLRVTADAGRVEDSVQIVAPAKSVISTDTHATSIDAKPRQYEEYQDMNHHVPPKAASG